MPVYYYEGNPIVTPFTITSNEPFFSAETLSLKQQRASQGAQRWELSFQVQNSGAEQDLLVGMVTNFGVAKSMVMPQLVTVSSKATVTVNGQCTAAVKGATSVSVNFTQDAKLLPKGSFVRFSNHTKLYLVTADVTTSSSSAVAIPIFPALQRDVTTANSLYTPNSTTKPSLQYYRSLDTLRGITYEDGILINQGTITLVEAL